MESTTALPTAQSTSPPSQPLPLHILDVKFYATSGESINGKRRPTSFKPYITVRIMPEFDPTYPYTSHKISGGTLYFREHRGIAEFFLHNPRDEAGYGGRVFTGTSTNGSTFNVKGPWSSSCSTVNALGLGSEILANVAMRGRDDTIYYSTHVTLSILHQIAEFVSSDWELVVPDVFDGLVSSPVTSPTPDMSDEQNQAITHGSPHSSSHTSTLPYFQPTRDLSDCPGCEGRSYNPSGECPTCKGSGRHRIHPDANKCWDCHGRGYKTKSCEICGRRMCSSGIDAYPFLVL